MAKVVLAVLIGLFGAAAVHIAVIFLIPQVADNNAWGRLSRIGPMYAVVGIDALRAPAAGPVAGSEGSRTQDFAFVDPGFLTASCRFSLADGPVRVSARERTSFWSASIYTREGDNVYSINDRSAVGGQFDLLIGQAEQLVAERATSADSGEVTIPVEVDLTEGFLTLRALVAEESQRPSVAGFLRSVTCARAEPAETPAPAAG